MGDNGNLSDLNRVDFANVQEQASWVCRCEAGVVQRLEQDFKATLQQHNSLEQWALWLDAVVGRVLKPHLGTPAFPRAAKLFLLKWSFYRWGGAEMGGESGRLRPKMRRLQPKTMRL
ncbi:DNA-binding protein RFX2-like [Coturnix japonica]|uniref:DNA-binding protein RFX2-like n=1 Tax=Coturnix japonica TaxID=93934 RepID=UPI000777B34E|nr:DNA-binding protein RFX2-like [Coturnix japonica]